MNVSVNTISLVDADSYWIDGYFEETNLAPIRVDDSARIKLMSYSQIVRGHVDSIARAIDVSNAQPDRQGVATVNPKIRSRSERYTTFGAWTWRHATLRHAESVGEVIDPFCPYTNEVSA